MIAVRMRKKRYILKKGEEWYKGLVEKERRLGRSRGGRRGQASEMFMSTNREFHINISCHRHAVVLTHFKQVNDIPSLINYLNRCHYTKMVHNKLLYNPHLSFFLVLLHSNYSGSHHKSLHIVFSCLLYSCFQ